ncbi:hypothetical protein QM306_05625, partial [Burkholderia cenocepacia]|nr:hypothetical protein [Burkholderia cenocepacia]
LIPVEADVDKLVSPDPTALTARFVELSWDPFIASVLVAEIRPAATLVIVRSAPELPTLTVDPGAVPAKLYSVPLIVVVLVEIAAAVTELAPRATALLLVDVAP